MNGLMMNNISNQVLDQVWNKVVSHIIDQVYIQVEDQVLDGIERSVWDSVRNLEQNEVESVRNLVGEANTEWFNNE